MRVFLAGVYFSDNGTRAEIDAYLTLGDVIVNTFLWSATHRCVLTEEYRTNAAVTFVCIDPANCDALFHLITDEALSCDVVVLPPSVTPLETHVLESLNNIRWPVPNLRAIGCPNDSIGHLGSLLEAATDSGVAIINTPGLHAQAVAEYTLIQIGFSIRKFAEFYDETGSNGQWPHVTALTLSQLMRGKTLGVIGGSGKDGAALIALAMRWDLRVVAIGSGSEEGLETIRASGAEVASDLCDLLASSDFISINCRSSQATKGLIGSQEIAKMKRGVIIINPAGAEIIDKQSLLLEFRKPTSERNIGMIVMDMPYGGRRDDNAFRADGANTELRDHGVRFTPRVAGYTIETGIQAANELAKYLFRYIGKKDISIPIVNRKQLFDETDTRTDLTALEKDVVALVHEAGREATRLRDIGLSIVYKQDGTPTTNADIASETIICSGLRAKGHLFTMSGEESGTTETRRDTYELIVDGIDGTRNFRDFNYGWCITVAVRINGETKIAVVYDPHMDETYTAIAGLGATVTTCLRERKLTCPDCIPSDFSYSVGSFRINGSSARKAIIIEDIKRLGGRGREWGSVALSICAVARGGLGAFIQSDAHLHDHAAAALIAYEAGAKVTLYITRVPDRTGIIVTHPSLLESVCSIYERHQHDPH